MTLLDSLNDLTKQKLIRRSNHATLPLSIYNYTELVQYKKKWDDLTLSARGIVLDTNTGQVVARPFRKFFNLEQQIDPVPSTVRPLKIYEKVDGSLGILFHYEGQWVCASRGSFHSEQAEKMTELVKPLLELQPHLDTKYTYIFEIIYPENRIVVNYHETSELVLLGVVNTETGSDYFEFGAFIPGLEGNHIPGIRLVKELFEISENRQLTGEDIRRLKAADLNNEEGYVVRYENGVRIKIKFENYLLLHKSWTNFSTLIILEWIQHDRNDRVINHLEQIPDEFHTEAAETEKMVLKFYEETEAELTRKIEACRDMEFRDVPDSPEKGIICQQLRMQRSVTLSTTEKGDQRDKIRLAYITYVNNTVRTRFFAEGLLSGSKFSSAVASQVKKEENARLKKMLKDSTTQTPLLGDYVCTNCDLIPSKIPTMTVLIGISGSGKSFRAAEIVNSRKPNTTVVISRDYLRMMFSSHYWGYPGHVDNTYYSSTTHLREREDLVTAMQDSMIRIALESNHSIVIDNTHLKFEYIENLIKSYASKAAIVFERLKRPVKECISRQQSRNEQSRTPEVQIIRQYNMLNRLEKLMTERQFDLKATYYRPAHPPSLPLTESEGKLPLAYVVDLDGTLCEHVNRSPYDFHLVHLDRVFPRVKDLVLDLRKTGKSIIICSGRPDRCKSASIQWLVENEVPFDEVHFRANEDQRMDWMVKEDMWSDISTRFQIQMMIEDRDQVVAAARKNGYTVAQVAYGDF